MDGLFECGKKGFRFGRGKLGGPPFSRVEVDVVVVHGDFFLSDEKGEEQKDKAITDYCGRERE